MTVFNIDAAFVTRAGSTLDSAVMEAFLDAGATVCGADITPQTDDDFLLAEPARIEFY